MIASTGNFRLQSIAPLIAFCLSFTATIVACRVGAPPASRLPDECRVIGMGINAFIRIPDTGESVAEFMARVPLPAGTEAVQILDPEVGAYDHSSITIRLSGSSVDRPPWNTVKHIQAGKEIWLLGEHDTPFLAGSIIDHRVRE